MKTKFKNFQEFRRECECLYDMYEPHFLLQDYEIITNFEGNEIDRGCWYCIVKIRENVHTILAYDHTGESDDNPFVIYCDWSQQPSVVGKSGHFTECKEFSNLEESFHFMVQEPSRHYIRYGEDCVLISEKDKYEAVFDYQEGFGLLDSIKLINSDDFYKGKTIEIYQPKSYGRTVLYQKKIQ